MEFRGHVGAAMVAYSPIALVTTSRGAAPLAIVGLVITVALASFPDVDQHLPSLAHRGPTHTLWFALVVGGGCAAAFALGVDGAGPSPDTLAGFGFVVGATAVLSHLVVDALTPMGVAPFAPFGRRYSLGVTTSASRAANRRSLGAGIVVTAVAFAFGRLLAPA